MVLWSTYWTASEILIGPSPSSRYCSAAIVPVASCSSAWSTFSAISSPGAQLPPTRCSRKILVVRFIATEKLLGTRARLAQPSSRPCVQYDARHFSEALCPALAERRAHEAPVGP